MKHLFRKILAIIFVASITPLIAMSNIVQMYQFNEYTKKIQEFFTPYLSKISTDSKLYDRVKELECNGTYNPQTFELIIAALQYEIGEKPDGWFGIGTEQKCPMVTNKSSEVLIRIVQAGLYFNTRSIPFDGIFSEETTSAVKCFQQFMCLPQTGIVDGITMKALFSSGGSKARPALGCDCATQLTKESSQALYDAGYRYVGRYLTSKQGGLQKHLTIEEISCILSAGLRFIVFFQEGLHNQQHCTSEQGEIDAEKAIEAANSLKIPTGSTIYGVVDADVDAGLLIPYFSNMSALIRSAGFEFGVYGSRAGCSVMHERGISRYSYVCGMSYRYKGNFGYPMPANWAFNQEYPLMNRKEKGDERFKFSGGVFDLDRVVVSGQDNGIGTS